MTPETTIQRNSCWTKKSVLVLGLIAGAVSVGIVITDCWLLIHGKRMINGSLETLILIWLLLAIVNFRLEREARYH